MLPFTYDWDINTPGSDTHALLFIQLKQQYPSLNIGELHFVKNIQHFPETYKPERTLLEIGHRLDPGYSQRFVYNRYRLTRYVDNPIFDISELDTVQSMSAVELAMFLTNKLNLNISPLDFLIEPAGISYTGGEQRPNWRLQPKPDSPFWYDSKIIWLWAANETPPPV